MDDVTLQVRANSISSYIEGMLNDVNAMFRRNGEGLYIEYEILTCSIAIDELLNVIEKLGVEPTERCEVELIQNNMKKRIRINDRCINGNIVFYLPDGTNVVVLKDKISGLVVQIHFSNRNCVAKIVMTPLLSI